VLAGALKQAREARLFILETMARTIAEPREVLSSKAPRVVTMTIPVDKIGEVIGPKGKRINEIIALTGADIDIQDDGTIFVGSREGEGAEKAMEMIDGIVNPHLPEVGERIEGTVVSTTTFGAFVNIGPGRDGLVHISRLGRGKRIANVEDAVRVGDKLLVEVVEVDPAKGKVGLKPVGEGWDPPEGGWPRVEGEDHDRGGDRRERRDGREGRDRFRPRRDRDRRERGDRGDRPPRPEQDRTEAPERPEP
jgi:polyribonucleotide nucleotidyltransferase